MAEPSKIDLKKAYDLEHLVFFDPPDIEGVEHMIQCRYSSVPEEDSISFLRLNFLLKALSAGQASVYFEDVGKVLIGADNLRREYLIFVLAKL